MENEYGLLAAVLEGNLQKVTNICKGRDFILNRPVVGAPAGETVLHIAAEEGHSDIVSFILRVNWRLALPLNGEGLTPLHLACRGGHVDVVTAFFGDNGERLFKIRDNEGRSPLHFAALLGDREIIDRVLTHFPHLLWSLTGKGETLLHIFAKDKNLQHNIQWLVELVPRNVEGFTKFVNKKDKNGNTILHLLALNNYRADIINKLFARFARDLNVNAVNADGSTALDIALDRVGFCHRLPFIYTLYRVGGQTSKKVGWLRRKRTLVPLPEEESKCLKKFRTSLLGLITHLTLLTLLICAAGISPLLGCWTSDGSFVRPLTSAKIQHTTGMCILPQTRPQLQFVLKNAIFSGIISFVVTQAAMLLNNSGFGWKFVLIPIGSLVLTASSIFNVFSTFYYVLNNITEPKHAAYKLYKSNIVFRWIFIAYSILVFVLVVIHSSYLGRFLRWANIL